MLTTGDVREHMAICPNRNEALPMEQADMASMGGKARRDSMTAEERRESARKAVNARWAKVRAAARAATRKKKTAA